ncbi:MAG: hypothetical protein LBO63_03575 [Oscillospiraceae bacterium]|nr:hypothetical protein [Oscillospiraceae bacterium]
MDNLNDLLAGVLSDPEKLSQIASLASSLGISMPQEAAASPPAPETTEPTPAEQAIPASALALANVLGAAAPAGRQKRELLSALNPYLSERQRHKLSRAEEVTRMLSIVQAASKLNKSDIT